MNKISSQDRSALIRLASSLPSGDRTRKAILAALQFNDAGQPLKFNEKGRAFTEDGRPDTDWVPQIFDGRHTLIFGDDPTHEMLTIAKNFGGKIQYKGSWLDYRWMPQDWQCLVFPSKDEAFAFVSAVDWGKERHNFSLHPADVRAIGAPYAGDREHWAP